MFRDNWTMRSRTAFVCSERGKTSENHGAREEQEDAKESAALIDGTIWKGERQGVL